MGEERVEWERNVWRGEERVEGERYVWSGREMWRGETCDQYNRLRSSQRSKVLRSKVLRSKGLRAQQPEPWE